MTENGTEENDSDLEEQVRGFRLGVGLRPLSEILGDLIEVNASEVPPPSERTVEWETVSETGADSQRGSDERGTHRKRRVDTDSAECLIDTRWTDDEFVVTADVPGAGIEDVSVGIDPRTNELVINRDDAVVGRVDLPYESPEATQVWFNNGVLEVRIRPADA